MNEPAPDTQGEWLFYVARPCYVVVKGTYAQAKDAYNAVLEMPNLPGEPVNWFNKIPNVDRAGMNDDPCEPMDNGRIEEY